MSGKLYVAIFYFSIVLCSIAAKEWNTNCGLIPDGYEHSVPPWTVIIRVSAFPQLMRCVGVLINRDGESRKTNLVLIPENCKLTLTANNGPFDAYIGSSENPVRVVAQKFLLKTDLSATERHRLAFLSFPFAVVETSDDIDLGETAQTICLPRVEDGDVPMRGHAIGQYFGRNWWRGEQHAIGRVDDDLCNGDSYVKGKMFCALDIKEGGIGASDPGSPYYAETGRTGRVTLFGFQHKKQSRSQNVHSYHRIFPREVHSYLHAATRVSSAA